MFGLMAVTAPKKWIVLLACLTIVTGTQAQVLIKGTVYDRSGLRPLPSASVMSVSGMGTRTDSLGHYHLKLLPTDSIYFSYLGRTTPKMIVKEIDNADRFDMSLDVGFDSLRSIMVLSHDYLQDSVQNRLEYQKVFNFNKTYVDNSKPDANVGVGLNLDLLFDAKSIRRMESMQSRLEWDEKEKYIDHKFTIALVKRITGLESPALDSFMRRFRPDYETLKSFETEWDYYKYLQEESKLFLVAWKQEQGQE